MIVEKKMMSYKHLHRDVRTLRAVLTRKSIDFPGKATISYRFPAIEYYCETSAVSE